MSKNIKLKVDIDELVVIDLALYYLNDQLKNGHMALQGSEKEYYLKHSEALLKSIDVIRGGKSAY
ncbi:hypothetical protein ACTXMV_12515 [Psychrobacter celer]|uniref:hypothetical protein n=1 Tax=Psychrobacter celer TaxID=306572 RepID=UPI003FD16491